MFELSICMNVYVASFHIIQMPNYKYVQTVDVPKDIMKLIQDINVELRAEDESRAPNETNYVRALPFSFQMHAWHITDLINVPEC